MTEHRTTAPTADRTVAPGTAAAEVTRARTADLVAGFLDDLGTPGGTVRAHLLDPDVVLDATVPMWRLEVAGEDAVRGQLAAWFSTGVTWEAVRRLPIPGGEAVEIDFAWVEDGIAHAGHQVHLLEIEHGRIARDTMFCGGRWPAGLLAEMEAARAC